jgi:nucleotide-binding universal stress UspA family protein
MKAIIAATDFSPASINAVNYASDMALHINAGLTLLNVYTLPVVYDNGAIYPETIEKLGEDSERKLAKLKNRVEKRTAGRLIVDTRSRMGNIAEVLESICDVIHPFTVVIGTRGKSNDENILFGSVALTIIKKLTWPVLCVPPGRTFGKGICKTGLASDFKKVPETTPEKTIKEFLKEFDTALHIINIDHKAKRIRTGAPEDSFFLHQMFYDQKPQYHFIDRPDVEEGIDSFACENKLDLLITIPKKHSLLAGLFKSARTKKLIGKAHVPILCIHDRP